MKQFNLAIGFPHDPGKDKPFTGGMTRLCGMVLGRLEHLSARNLLFMPTLLACLTIFITVGMRGSLGFAYSETFYAMELSLLLYLLWRLGRSTGIGSRSSVAGQTYVSRRTARTKDRSRQ